MITTSWVIFIRENTGEVLITKRSKVVRNPKMWNFPGGSTKKKLKPKKLARKEAWEEVGLTMGKIKSVLVVRTTYKSYFYYLVPITTEDIKLNYESSKYRWCEIDKLKGIKKKHKSLNLFLKNIKYVKELKKKTYTRVG